MKCYRFAIFDSPYKTEYVNKPVLRRGLTLLCGLDAGVLLCAGLAAPIIFAALAPDHVNSGRLAAQLFELSYWITALVALLILIYRMRVAVAGKAAWLAPASLLALTVLQLIWVVPALLHQGQGWPFSFGALHGTASVVHVLLFLTALVVSWQLGE
jgi:hypothetical protein